MGESALLWIGSIATVVGLALIGASRPFHIEKLSVAGIEMKFHNPISSPGYRVLKFPGGLVVILGLCSLVYSGAMKAFPETWPTKFARLKTAELQLSDVDDRMYVRVNGTLVTEARYGETPGWASFKAYLHQGSNSIEVIIENDRYGGCGGTLTLRLNGLLNPDFKWS